MAQDSAGHRIGWAAQARSTVVDAQRYTRFVALMKRVLLAAAAALLLAVVAYSLQPRDTKQYALTFERMGQIADDLAMTRPRLLGTDSDGNPFTVTADRAVQDPRDTRRARLFDVDADLTGKDGAWYDVLAPHGFLDSTAQKLWLTGNVALYSSGGYELHTASVFVDLAAACGASSGRKRRASKPGKPPARCAKTAVRGDEAVVGQGPFGNLRADRFRVEKGSKRIFLDGHIRTILYPAHGAKSVTRKIRG